MKCYLVIFLLCLLSFTAYADNEEQINVSVGWSVVKRISSADTNLQVVKTTPAKLGGWALSNANAAPRYLKLYNNASPIVGTSIPVMTVLIPGNTSGVLANFEATKGVPFRNGMAFAITTGFADSDTAAPSAGDVIVNLFYR